MYVEFKNFMLCETTDYIHIWMEKTIRIEDYPQTNEQFHCHLIISKVIPIPVIEIIFKKEKATSVLFFCGVCYR